MTMQKSALAEILHSGLSALGEDPAVHLQTGYLAYLALLQRWNKTYNLSGVRDPARMLTHHVLDSLAVLPHLQGARCLDVGSGAGLPGLILALARPATHWVLLDSNGKKVRFLNQCVRELAIANVDVVQARVESYEPGLPFDTIISRAFGSLTAFYAATVRLLAPGGVLLAMKGPAPEAELEAEITDTAEVTTIPLQVPGVEGGRTLVKIKQRHATSHKSRGNPIS